MNETGIFEGDILVVDKSIPVRHTNIVLVVMDGEFCIRSLFKRVVYAVCFSMAIRKRNCLKLRK